MHGNPEVSKPVGPWQWQWYQWYAPITDISFSYITYTSQPLHPIYHQQYKYTISVKMH